MTWRYCVRVTILVSVMAGLGYPEAATLIAGLAGLVSIVVTEVAEATND